MDDPQLLTPGSRTDFDALYRSAYSNVFNTMLAIVGDRAGAEDCAQDAFVRAFRAWHRWRPDSRPEVWLHRIAVNVAFTHRRRRMWHELPGHLGRDRRDQDAQMDLLAGLRQLPARQATAFVLRFYHGYTNAEIAETLGVSDRTVTTLVAKAGVKLRVVLGGNWRYDSPPQLDLHSPKRTA